MTAEYPPPYHDMIHYRIQGKEQVFSLHLCEIIDGCVAGITGDIVTLCDYAEALKDPTKELIATRAVSRTAFVAILDTCLERVNLGGIWLQRAGQEELIRIK